MSADKDPATLPPLTRKQLKELDDEMAHWLKMAHETPNDKLAHVAFGMAAGTKRAKRIVTS